MPTNRIVGVLLILLGGALLLVTTTGAGGEVLLAVIGLAFLVAYGATGTYGFLVPGAIVTGLAGGVLATRLGAPGAAVVLGLGAGFLAIALVDRVRGPVGSGWWWPVIPGAIVITVGVAALTGVDDLLAYLVPAALIVTGLSLLRRGGGGDGDDHGAATDAQGARQGPAD